MKTISNMKQRWKERQELNNELLKILSNFLEMNPEMRFNQALAVLDINNYESLDFYEESEDTLKRVENRIEQLKSAGEF